MLVYTGTVSVCEASGASHAYTYHLYSVGTSFIHREARML